MPIYAYRCEACGAEEEHLQKFSDPPVTECERCGGSLKKLLTPAAFHLKGGGWYKDGYASSKPEGGKGSDSKGAGTGDKTSGDKTSDSKKSGGGESSSSVAAKTATG